jgi:hypothetical protein
MDMHHSMTSELLGRSTLRAGDVLPAVHRLRCVEMPVNSHRRATLAGVKDVEGRSQSPTGKQIQRQAGSN